MHPGNAKNVAEGLTWRDRVLVAVPLVYTGAMVSCFMQFAVCAGGTMVLEADFDPDRYLDVIERQQVTSLTTVPVLWERMAMSPNSAQGAICRACVPPPPVVHRCASTSSRPTPSVVSTSSRPTA